MSVTLDDVITAETEATIYAKLIAILQAVGIDTESWQSGDPTRSLLDAASRYLAAEEQANVNAVASGFLDYASGEGLKLTAKQVFGVDFIPATYATCTFRFTNTGNALITIDPEDFTLLNSTTQKTYRNSTGGTLNPGSTLDVTIIAEEAGSASNAGVGEVDTIVNAVPKVSGASITVAVGTDEESPTALKSRCKAKLGSLSPNGPADAYDYVARTPSLVNNRVITRTRVVDDSTVGEVTVYIAGPSGAVDAPTVADVDAGLDKYANPLCNSLTTTSAKNLTFNVAYSLWVYSTVNKEQSEIEDLIEAALEQALTTRPIGGDVTPPSSDGYIYRGWLEATILQAVAPYGYRVVVTTPGSDTLLTAAQVAVLGTVTPTISIVEGP